MELTLREIVSAGEAIGKMAQKKNLKPKVFYWLTVTQRKLQNSLDAFQQSRMMTLYKYANPVEKTDNFEFKDKEARKKFNEEMDEFMKQTESHEINNILFSVLYCDPSLELTPALVTMLGPLIVMDDLPDGEKAGLNEPK
jgi:hypothetical protein